MIENKDKDGTSAASGADEERRQRERVVSEQSSGEQERRPHKNAEGVLKRESGERAVNAAIASKPSG